MRTINLVYIGDDFYHKSRTMMSSIYTESGERFDWGFTSIALTQGNNITIRQATPTEMDFYQAELEKTIKRFPSS
jgi:hypothetical protein